MSEELSFIEKVLKVQSELKAPKGQRNSFGKYNYRSAEDILTAVKPLNSEQGLLLTLTDKPILIGERYYVEATATLTDGKEQIKVTAPAREAQLKKGMDDSQITGAASSYARKYALNGLYLIDDTKDADTDEFNNQQKNARTINKTQQEALAKNFEKIAQLKQVSTKNVEAEFLTFVGFTGSIANLDDNIHHKLMELTTQNIAKIESENVK
ncbi:ERF family protein [Melissococcus plutonius]|uniref:ERF family protein n=1 Tax=Melissococcus plutonius TaxID=33970 RepID=UPI0021E52DF8|nr:ERF family protein [Melissococcus plutonius]MCV2501948.1 ERF family protein [Melissococcus plutonius]MCV2520611.1 ERF family protein [Melissococcus plutonius]MCV2528164.1 ERF family protein [Melissococcus plutonius]